MTDSTKDPKSAGDDQWITAPDPDEGKLTASDIAKGVGGVAAELGMDALQTLFSWAILLGCTALGLLIGFYIDGGSIWTVGGATIFLPMVGFVIGFVINYRRGHSVFFF